MNEWMGINEWKNETTSKGVIKPDSKYTTAFRIIPWQNFFFQRHKWTGRKHLSATISMYYGNKVKSISI